jgi:hypothetical protein
MYGINPNNAAYGSAVYGIVEDLQFGATSSAVSGGSAVPLRQRRAVGMSSAVSASSAVPTNSLTGYGSGESSSSGFARAVIIYKFAADVQTQSSGSAVATLEWDGIIITDTTWTNIGLT